MTTQSEQSVFGHVRCPNDEYLARALPEAALEPDMPIIDPHIHFWHLWEDYPYFLPDYARDLKASGHNVEASVFVECKSMYRADGPEHLKSVGETEFAAAMAASGKYTTSRVAAGIVAYVDLTQGELTSAALDAHIAAAGGRLRGIRQLGKWDADPRVKGHFSAPRAGLYREEIFGRGLDEITRRGLSFDASVFHPQLPDVAAMARAHPDANIVLIHTGSPVGHSSYAGREAENYAAWIAGIKEVATCPNVSLKMGGILINVASFDYTTAETPPTSEQLVDLWRPYFEPCIELFGPSRCMVSSNFPVDKAGFGYGAMWNMYKRLTAKYSADERAMMFSGTAKRIYRV
jgi:L-fuconolactonase